MLARLSDERIISMKRNDQEFLVLEDLSSCDDLSAEDMSHDIGGSGHDSEEIQQSMKCKRFVVRIYEVKIPGREALATAKSSSHYRSK